MIVELNNTDVDSDVGLKVESENVFMLQNPLDYFNYFEINVQYFQSMYSIFNQCTAFVINVQYS